MAEQTPVSLPNDWFDISDEKSRTYFFPNGERYVVLNPEKLQVKQKAIGDSHRIQAKGGIGHYVRPGWLAIQWEVHAGRPTVAF